jgi:hypothetical protein
MATSFKADFIEIHTVMQLKLQDEIEENYF